MLENGHLESATRDTELHESEKGIWNLGIQVLIALSEFVVAKWRRMFKCKQKRKGFVTMATRYWQMSHEIHTIYMLKVTFEMSSQKDGFMQKGIGDTETHAGHSKIDLQQNR